MPDFISAALSKIIGDEPREAVIMSIIIFFILIFIIPISWMPDGVFRTTVGYAAMFCVSIYISRLILFVVTTINKSITKRKLEKEEIDKASARISEINNLFDSLTPKEIDVIAMAIDRGKQYISLKRGDELAMSLQRKGLIAYREISYSEMQYENLIIKPELYEECYRRYAGYFNE